MRRLAARALPLLALGCASAVWDEAELRRIHAIDDALGRRLPALAAAKDFEGLRSLHSPGATADSPLLDLADRFERIEDARLWIHDRAIDPANLDRSTLSCRYRLSGIEPGGARATVEATLEIAVEGGADRPTVRSVRLVREKSWRSDAPFFEDATRAAGLETAGEPFVAPPPKTAAAGRFTLGVGGAVLDYDGDGFEDLILGTARGLELWRNLGGRRFERVEGWLSDPVGEFLATGLCAADFDNDGDPDVAAGRFKGPPLLLRNDGNGVFRDATAAAGFPPLVHPTSLAAADYDRDGDLDLYVACLGDFLKETPWPMHRASNGERNRLLRNEGGLRFADVSRSAGVADSRWTHAAVWGDLDDDGWPDLYLANDFSTNALYRNRRDGTFVDVAEALGAENRGNGMGADLGDANGDLRPDVYASEMFAPHAWSATSPGFPLPVPWYMRWERIRPLVVKTFREMLSGNALLLAQEDGSFRLRDDDHGARIAGWAWGCNFLDADNDGDPDLYVANGQYSGDTPDIGRWLFESTGTLDMQMVGFATGDLHLLASAAGLDGERLRREGKRVNLHGFERNPLFLNDGTGAFVDAGFILGADRVEDARSILVLDADRDGRLDLFVRNWMAPPVLLRNVAPRRRFLAVSLAGTASNAQGIGAKVVLRAGGRSQHREARAGSGYLSSSSPIVHFGLGDATRVEELSIRWPSGRVQVLRDLEVDRFVRIVEPTAEG